MMSIRAVHAGQGYRYLLRSVATNDADPGAEKADRLSEYYAAKGTPAGRWIGSGLSCLDSDTVTGGSVINEAQMAALYGEGLHPDADAMMAAGATVKDCQLGRAFPLYTADQPVLVDVAAAEKRFRADTGRRPTEQERSEIAVRAGYAHFADAHHGVSPTTTHEVVGWVNKQQDSIQQARAGYDLTFSPVKSVSVLWALADEDTASIIATAHHKAVAEALSFVEDNALYTRIGVGGIQQVKTTGLIASEFTHFDTRGGDPDLHSHVLVSNKVQIADTPEARKAGKVGHWASIHNMPLFEHAQAASGIYNLALQHHLHAALGVEFVARESDSGAEPVWEIDGVDEALITTFSSRRSLAKPVYESMVADYVATHSRQPSRRINYELWQAAILETRDAKRPAETLSVLRGGWRESAKKVWRRLRSGPFSIG